METEYFVLTVLYGNFRVCAPSDQSSPLESPKMPSRRGSVSITAHSGIALAIHTRTHDEEDLPHATKRFVASIDTSALRSSNVVICRTMADHLRRYESLYETTLHSLYRTLRDFLLRFTLTPPRMRMIVEAFKEALELGLEKPNQVVVCTKPLYYLSQNRATWTM